MPFLHRKSNSQEGCMNTKGELRRAGAAAGLAVVATVWGAGPLSAQQPQTQQAEHRWSVSFEGTGEWEDVSAMSYVQWAAGASSFTANLRVSGDESEAVRPWHVHQGTCAQGGEVVGGGAHYPALNMDSGGSAEATAVVATALDPAARYHVNVHRSPSEMNTIVACGDLVMQPH
jgi:hypothetical protein